MAVWLLREEEVCVFLCHGRFSERYAPVRASAGARFVRLDGHQPQDLNLRPPRAPMSVKPFCFPSTELVAHYSAAPTAPVTATAPLEARCLVAGVRPCELRAIGYLDRVFGHLPVKDPFYHAHREQQVVVSVDCIEPHASCFCSLVGGKPYAAEGFDVNLTPIEGAYVVEAGSQAGREFVEQARDNLTEATGADLAARDRVRRAAMEELEKANAGFVPARPPEQALAEKEDAEIWDRLALGCVECGACTHICPTCHCFYLLDQAHGAESYERLRSWDSCMWSGYSRMAGAPLAKPNPRSRFRSRFANRFLHKYLWSPKQWDMVGCVGCGRCIEACPGRIDLRRVIREVSA